MESPFDVFLSHNGQDKPAVREICTIPRGRGSEAVVAKALRRGIL